MDLSIVIPIKDERDNLGPLHERLTRALAPLGKSYEIVIVDDGSVDGSYPLLEQLAARDSHLKVVRLRRLYKDTVYKEEIGQLQLPIKAASASAATVILALQELIPDPVADAG